MEKQKTKRRLPVFLRWALWVLLVQLVLFNISAALYAYKFTHVYDDPSLRVRKNGGNVFTRTWRLFSGPRQPRSVIIASPIFTYDTVVLKTKNGILIDAWYSKPDSAAKGTVILFHGIMANKGMLAAEAAEFRYQGYNVMLIDFRAHGNSAGNTTTIGFRESEEVKLAYDYLAGKGERNIFLYGNSMGAAAVTRAVAEYNLRPAGIILEMPFASLQSHLRARARAQGFRGIGEKPFGFLVTLWIGVERGFSGFNYKTTTYAKKVNCPVLMQWGALDRYVLRAETDKVYKAIGSSDKKLVVYEKAAHESLLQNEPAKWRLATEAFFSNSTK